VAELKSQGIDLRGHHTHDSTDFAFGNVPRSRKVFREVWSQNQGGKVFVDWVDVVDEFDWELFLV
jgi:hypothetical protein